MSTPDNNDFLQQFHDKQKNLEGNRERWGNLDKWKNIDKFGYQWGNNGSTDYSLIAIRADNSLRPFLNGRYDLKILEISPGAGRFTAELIRYAKALDLLDMNQVCLDICTQRFQYYTLPIRYFLNDGEDCSMLKGNEYDLIASYDSMVHVHPTILENYFRQWSELLAPGGILFIDHSGKGIKSPGFRTAVTAEMAKSWVENFGLALRAQIFRNNHDCITVASRPEA